MEEQQVEIVRRRPWLRGWRIPSAILLVLLLIAAILLWAMRVELASDYIDRELARRGVQATYQVKRIGFGRQILENLVIGDPRRPDATVRHVEVQLLLGLAGPRVGLIKARGVRLFGRIEGGRLRLGQVDRLLPPPSGLPFRLPDQLIDVDDAAIALATPAGPVAFGLTGSGNVADGFRGRLAMISHRLALGRCAIEEPRANVAVSVDDLRPTVRGPVATRSLRCGNDLAIEQPLLAVDATFAPAIDSWRGESAIRAARLRVAAHNAAAVQGRLTFSGNARRTAGQLDLGTGATAVDAFRAGRTRIAGRYAISPRSGDLVMAGDVAIDRLTVAPARLAGLVASLRSVRETPLGPVGERLADALANAARGGGGATGRFRIVNGHGFGGVRFEQLQLLTRSGARLAASGGEGITYDWAHDAMRLDGDFVLTGGDFPDARFALRQPAGGAPLQGVGRIAPIRAGAARLELAEIRFAAGADGRTRFRTALRLDGPFSGGRISGLTLPVQGRFGRGGLAIGEGCVTASFRELRFQSLRLGAGRLPLCPVGPALVWQAPRGDIRFGADLRAPRFAGRLGRSPIRIASDRLRVDTEGFEAGALAIRLGAAGGINRLDVARLDGRFVPRGVAGAFAGLSGKLANVPLLVGDGAGRWQLLGGRLQMEGRVQVADALDPPRFYPLVSDDFRLTLVDNRIHASGWLEHPASNTRVTEATIDHDLTTGAGQALLDVPGITFHEGFQPEALTRLTTGVVALVQGTVTGRGRIDWGPSGTRSTGDFATADMNLAAPFGPVEGLTTNIHFTDLLGLTSAPGQVAKIDLIQPGIDVYDGRVAYQLLPDYHVGIESGRWPYAGGELFLEPTVLDFSQPSTKHLTFRVVGLDAARFIQNMEFSNISATGIFDGIIPMEFDQGGGRVVGGRLSARPGGGTLSYIGELTDRDLGVYGKMAFDALKELRYDRFDMTLDGDLAGEFVTRIDLDGVARNPTTPIQAPGGAIGQLVVGRALSELRRIPFQFNIRIKGPFRALIGTARSFQDPSLLIQPALPRLLRDLPTTVTDVQDEESENQR